ncbi:MAG: biotin/lipoate A/B protein ligase family protein [Pirellulales bacterium]
MSHANFRLIVDEPASGPWNMAVDEALLEAAVAGSDATLRLYQWNEPTLSLGYFQRYNDRTSHAASRECAVVRRQSGGGAILHDRELTYSLTLPPGHRLGRDATVLYNAVHKVFIAVLEPQLSAAAAESWRLALNGIDSKLAPSEEPFLCFQRRACGDLLLESRKIAATNSAPQAYKILGSAQRRHRGAILQHGSLLVSTSPAAPELAGWQELTGVMLPLDTLIAGVVRQSSGAFGLELQPAELPVAVHDAAREIERNKYSSRSWTARR